MPARKPRPGKPRPCRSVPLRRTMGEQGECRDGRNSRRKIEWDRWSIDLPKRSCDDAREKRGDANAKRINPQSTAPNAGVHAFDDQCLEHGVGQRVEKSIESHGQPDREL